LLGIAAIGVVVMSIMLFTQGYLSQALNQADAVLAGRRAEYLSDAALAEALWILQTGRNSTYQSLFDGSATTIQPTRAQALAPPGTVVADVSAEVNDLTDFHGDGRGYYGQVLLKGQVGVPRRVSRALGISAWRTVQLGFEFRNVDMAPPTNFADKMLYVHEMKDLERVQTWYYEEVQERWEQVRVSTQQEIKRDADVVVGIFADLIAFMGKASDLLNRTDEWPDILSSIGGGPHWYSLSPKVKVDGPGFGIRAEAEAVRVYLDSNGDVKGKGKFGPIRRSWEKSGRSEVPAIRPVIREVVDDALEELTQAIFGEGKDTALSALEEAAGKSANTFYGASNSNLAPLSQMARDVQWPKFRNDGADLSAPAYVAADRLTVNQDELLIHPPNPPSPFLDSPLNGLTAWRNFEVVKWRDVVRQNFNDGSLTDPFTDTPDLWEEYFVPYHAAWETELRRYQELIHLDQAPDETPITPAYWAKMAAYEFPDTATGQAYITSRWGRAGAVYRFLASGSLDIGTHSGSAAFVASVDNLNFDVSGESAGAKIVAARKLDLTGTTRAMLFSPETPIRFDGNGVSGIVAAGGLLNDGSSDLDHFNLTHDPFDDSTREISISEYPVFFAIDRGE
jgi:hypothetical protein